MFTKLSYNYLAVEQHGETANLFKVCYNGHESTFPDEFVQALERNGHTIQVCPRSTITTFGIAACVKEDDGSWTNIPIAFFFRTGFEDRNGKPAYFAAPHGGLDMKIRGPLVGEGNNCDIQFYVAIEGLCGWHSNHNADVPWIRAVATTDVYSGDMALRAVRMAGLLGVTFNALATEVRKSTSLLVLIWPTSLPNIKHSQMNLPFGGMEFWVSVMIQLPLLIGLFGKKPTYTPWSLPTLPFSLCSTSASVERGYIQAFQIVICGV